jgi:hypothetical protein
MGSKSLNLAILTDQACMKWLLLGGLQDKT